METEPDRQQTDRESQRGLYRYREKSNITRTPWSKINSPASKTASWMQQATKAGRQAAAVETEIRGN